MRHIVLHVFTVTSLALVSGCTNVEESTNTESADLRSFGSFEPRTLAVGSNHTCAVRADGTLWCWGSNDHGQLGTGDFTARTTPARVSQLPKRVRSVVAAGASTCALANDGALFCWGGNISGQLGDGTHNDRSFPGSTIGNVVDFDLGARSGCAVLVGGQVQCWGDNDFGEVGIGSLNRALTPTTVPGLSNAISVTVGTSHACALTAQFAGDIATSVYCWGNNAQGQLGTGTGVSSLSPVAVSLKRFDQGSQRWVGAKQISAGASHTCAVFSNGGLSCWGANDRGQLGSPSASNVFSPTAVGIELVESIAARSSTTCALTSAGRQYCWGANNAGQVGDSLVADALAPKLVPFVVNAVGIDTGSHTCARRIDGSIICWGQGISGELGDGSTQNSFGARTVALTGTRIAHVLSSPYSQGTAATRSDGLALLWGANRSGQLGIGTFVDALSPQTPLTLGVVASLATGDAHGCAVRGDGGLYCWGENGFGQLGDGTFTTRSAPVAVGPSHVLAVTAGRMFTCVLRDNGQVQCWGRNDVGQLGDSTTAQRSIPVTVTRAITTTKNGVPVVSFIPMGGIVSIAAGADHVCAVANSGQVLCWGSNAQGTTGRPISNTHPGYSFAEEVPGLSNIIQVAGAVSHTCALSSSGIVSCWGNNALGQLGDGTTSPSARITPVAIGSLNNVVQIAAGDNHTCALAATGTVHCWGENDNGEIGNGLVLTRQLTPAQVTLPLPAVEIAAGRDHTCAQLEDSSLWCWGKNDRGQLGLGFTSASQPMPSRTTNSLL